MDILIPLVKGTANIPYSVNNSLTFAESSHSTQMKKPETNGTVFKFDLLAASSNALPLARSIFLKPALSSSTFFKASWLLYIFAINCCPLLTQLDHVFLAENSKTLLNSSATASSH